jgi:hypothetical protein
MWKEANPL